MSANHSPSLLSISLFHSQCYTLTVCAWNMQKYSTTTTKKYELSAKIPSWCIGCKWGSAFFHGFCLQTIIILANRPSVQMIRKRKIPSKIPFLLTATPCWLKSPDNIVFQIIRPQTSMIISTLPHKIWLQSAYS